MLLLDAFSRPYLYAHVLWWCQHSASGSGQPSDGILALTTCTVGFLVFLKSRSTLVSVLIGLVEYLKFLSEIHMRFSVCSIELNTGQQREKSIGNTEISELSEDLQNGGIYSTTYVGRLIHANGLEFIYPQMFTPILAVRL